MLKYLNYLTVLLFTANIGFAEKADDVRKWQFQSGDGCSVVIENGSLILEDSSIKASAAAFSKSVKTEKVAAYAVAFDYYVRSSNKKSPIGGIFIKCYDNSGKIIKQTSAYHLYNTEQYKQKTLICKLSPETTKLNVIVRTYLSATGKIYLKNLKFQKLNDVKAIQDLSEKTVKISQRMFPEPCEDQIKLLAKSLNDSPFQVSPPVSDRQYWNHAAKIIPETDKLIEKAENMTKAPFPELNDELYLEYFRKGTRSYRESFHARTKILQTLVLAECFEGKGRFLKKIETYLDAILRERTWVLPAHDKGGVNFKGTEITVDLGAAARASLVTAIRTVLASKLSSQINDKIVTEVYRRVLLPYLKRIKSGDKSGGFFWITANFNWNAFCSSNIAYCAASLPDIKNLKNYIIAAALNSSKYFLAGFPEDGYCSEGIGYWSYGFGNYLLMAEVLFRYSKGKINLFERKDVKTIAGFGRNMELHDNVYPAFSDCPLEIKIKPFVLSVISSRIRRVPLPQKDLFRGTLPQILCSLSFFIDSKKEKKEIDALPLLSWFKTSGVLIVRDIDNRFSLAVKAGHNNEYHNHNDIGSYVLLSQDMLVNCDPGLEVYTNRTFSKHRYESNLLNSWGHAVPIVADKMQGTGKRFKGKILSYTSTNDADTIIIDLKTAYQVAALEVLQRKIVFDRKKKTVSICDKVNFSSPQKFGTALVTYESFDIVGKDKIIMKKNDRSIDVNISATGGTTHLESEVINENPAYLNKRPSRIGINFTAPVKEAIITVTYHL